MLKVRCGGQFLPPTLTVRQGAELAGCGVSAAYEACRQQRWPSVRISERRVVIATVPFLQMLGLALSDLIDVREEDKLHQCDFGQEKGGALR